MRLKARFAANDRKIGEFDMAARGTPLIERRREAVTRIEARLRNVAIGNAVGRSGCAQERIDRRNRRVFQNDMKMHRMIVARGIGCECSSCPACASGKPAQLVGVPT